MGPERELAEACGVSRTTIRWALAKLTADGLIKPVVGRTRLVAELPSRIDSLVGNAVYLFGGIHEGDEQWSPGWAGQLHLGVQRVLRAAGRSVLIPGSSIDLAMIDVLRRERPAGVILPESMYSGRADPVLLAAATALVGAGIPVVAFGEDDLPCDRVVSDHAGGASALSAWLIKRGRRRQLCLWPGPLHSQWQRQRLEGHQRALREAGLPPPRLEEVRWIDGETDFDRMVVTVAGHFVPHVLGPEPIDAILALTDGQVPAICAALRRCGREPGRDVVVVGYDANWHDAPERLRYPTPPAASVDKDNFGIGRAMAHLLEERIAGRLPAEPQVRIIPPRMVVSQED